MPSNNKYCFIFSCLVVLSLIVQQNRGEGINSGLGRLISKARRKKRQAYYYPAYGSPYYAQPYYGPPPGYIGYANTRGIGLPFLRPLTKGFLNGNFYRTQGAGVDIFGGQVDVVDGIEGGGIFRYGDQTRVNFLGLNSIMGLFG